MSIDFDKLLSDYLESLRSKYSNVENDPYVSLNLINMELSAKVCVSILKEYERLKSQDSQQSS